MPPATESIISCENLVAGYPDKPILQDINLEFRKGQITVLLGGSGSGKSTLLKTIVGLLPPLAGRIRLFGQDVQGLDSREHSELLARTGMLFQYGALLGSRSVYENIALPLRERTDLPEAIIAEMIRIKLALVGLEGIEERLPSGISGGQRKRVALVRASILDPEVIFADEPSAGLDPVAAAGLDELLRNFQKLFDMSMVVVTHELDSIRTIADHIIMLEAGSVLAQGSYEELATSRAPSVRNFFSRQAPDYAQSASGSSLLQMITPASEEPEAPR